MGTIVKHEHYMLHLFWNPPFCASTVSGCRCCWIHRYVAAPQYTVHIRVCMRYVKRVRGFKYMDMVWQTKLTKNSTFQKIVANLSQLMSFFLLGFCPTAIHLCVLPLRKKNSENLRKSRRVFQRNLQPRGYGLSKTKCHHLCCDLDWVGVQKGSF